MSRIFVIADTHFGHTNSWAKFKRPDGSPLRPFSSTEEMDETMVERWNSVVRPQDHVYHLGDVCIAKHNLDICLRLNGHKRLVRGNHDIFKTKDYLRVGFEEIYGCRVFLPNEQQGIPGAILSHIPLHPDSVKRWAINVHGHTHDKGVTLPTDIPELRTFDPRYICVSVEQTDYTPVLLSDLLKRHSERGA